MKIKRRTWIKAAAAAIASAAFPACKPQVHKLVPYLIPDDEIVGLNIPTGAPLVYDLDKDLKPTDRRYLGDPEKIKAAMAAVAAQGKSK